MKCCKCFFVVALLCCLSFLSNATLIELDPCTGANSCTITATPPAIVSPNPNDGILLAWDEVQNFTLTERLRVDRVFNASASFVTAIGDGSGDFWLAAGTVVSSHYLQWDPGNGSQSTVSATIKLDSQVFAFITADQNLFDSDFLGLASLDYNDFGLRGLESGDTTVFNDTDVDISWSASSPGDWTRLITALSPAAVSIPEPQSFILFFISLIFLNKLRKR